MSSTKKSLWASGISVLICAALLVGTSFAWFTDSVSNSGNKIKAGTLMIDAYCYDLEEGKTDFKIDEVNGGKQFGFSDTGRNLKTDKKSIIEENEWEPGISSAKLLKVENNGTLAAKIKLDFDVIENGLTEALWFDFVQVSGNDISGNFEKRPMSELESLAEAFGEVPILGGESLQFILVYGMYESAGNTYKGKSFAADISILATQYTHENDGFGSSSYDESASYTVEVGADDNIADVIANAEDGMTIKTNGDITITSANKISVTGGKSITLDLSGSTIDIDATGTSPISVAEGSALIITGDTGEVTTDTATYCVDNKGTLIVDGITISNTSTTTAKSAIRNYGNLTLKNANIKGTFYGVYNYGGTIDTIDNCYIEANGSGAFAIQNSGSGIIKEIKNSTVIGIKGLFDAYALRTNEDTAIENIENCSFDGIIENGGSILIKSGTFKNTGLDIEAFKALVAPGSSVTESNDVYTVTVD